MSSLFFLSVSHLWNFLINWLLLWTSPKIKKIQLIWQLLLDILLISWLGTPGKTLPKVIVLDATFLWWLSLCQIFEISIDIDDQRTLQSDWTRGTTVHTHPKSVVSDATSFLGVYLHAKNLRYWLTPFKNIHDQKILRFDWVTGKTVHTQSKVVVSDITFPWWIAPCKKN